MFKINSEKELLNLLKIVSVEAVKKSKQSLNESTDNAQERYLTQLKASENKYSVGLTEQEEEVEEVEEVEEEEESTATTALPDEAEAKKVIDPETLGVSFDSVVKDINTLRSGRSTKDKEIKEQLLGYYDMLDEDERKILHLFLGEISKILQGALDAVDAQDPSEPPFNAEITFGDDKPSKEADAEQQSTSKQNQNAQLSSPVEDSNPPIKVNERQELNEISKKIKRLMKRY
tara:strand:+ start:1853 stop:2548 length:696 start_codon:yes stop_codon:yes gene_type:complete